MLHKTGVNLFTVPLVLTSEIIADGQGFSQNGYIIKYIDKTIKG